MAVSFAGNELNSSIGIGQRMKRSLYITVNTIVTGANQAESGWIYNGRGSYGMINDSDSSMTVNNCTFSSNSGNGMFNKNASPTVTNCIFTDNTGSYGGGMLNEAPRRW